MVNKRTLSMILMAFFLGLFIWYFYTHIDDFKILLGISPIFLAIVIVGHILSIVTNGLFIRSVMQSSDKVLSFRKSLVASVISAVGNFFFPIGTGTAAQARYLKKNFGFNYKSFLSALSGNYIIVFLLNGLFGITALIILRDKADPFVFWTLSIIFMSMLLPNLYFAFIGIPRNAIRLFESSKKGILNRVGTALSDVMRGWNTITKNRSILYKLILYTLMNFLASMIISYASIGAVGLTIGIWPLILYSALGAVTLVLNITPGAIGIREGIYIFTTALIGLTTPQILVVAVIDRMSRFIVLIFGMGLFHDYFKKGETETVKS